MTVSAIQGSLLGWRAKAPSNKDQLRALLSDGRWHGQQAMQRAAGMRYGARLKEVHDELDLAAGLAPVHYQKRIDHDDDSRVSYRQVDKATCDLCSREARKSPSQVIEELRAEVAALRAENARLRGDL